MSDDLTFSKLLQKHFRSATEDKAFSLTQRTRIDARTVGYNDATDPTKVVWYGMSPVNGDDDEDDMWQVVEVVESPNRYLSQISENERLVKVKKTDNGQAMSFEKAVERLAVWELSSKMKGTSPVAGQNSKDIGHHYFRCLAMRRGFLINTVGDMVATPDILPMESGRFLKSDLEMMQSYRAGLKGSDKLDQLMTSQNPLYFVIQEDEDTSIQEDLESFGEIALFEKMHFFAEILVEYAKVQLQYIEEFYGHPERFADYFEGKKGLVGRMRNHALFFTPGLIDRINHTREQFAETIFKYFHVAQENWDYPLDFESKTMREQLLINPDAQETNNFMSRKICFPLDQQDINQILFIAARTLTFCSDMLKDSPQREMLRRKGLYKNGDIKDVMNFLDLLDVKYMYTELAEGAVALPHTQRYNDLKAQNEAFHERVDYLIANLEESADWSSAQKSQIDDFIKASSHVYLLDRIRDLPEKLFQAHQFISDRILPHPHQLSLDLYVAETTLEERVAKANPTRNSQNNSAKSAKQKGPWNKLKIW